MTISNNHTKKPLLKVIRKKCLDCCAYHHAEVRQCPIQTCPLWPFRMGKNPFHTRKMTTTQKQATSERLKEARKHKKAT